MMVASFSWDSGPPDDATLVIDCSHLTLPPMYMRQASGRHPDVAETVVEQPEARCLLEEAIAHCRENPDAKVAFGCRQGYHRSVALAELLGREVDARVIHFDLEAAL